jgi:hypothetical protein
MNFSYITAAVLLLVTSSSALSVTDDDAYIARQYLRCASFYLSGSTDVSRPELKKQLQQLANSSLHSAELLMEGNRPLVKAEFDAAREKFHAETITPEVKADTRGYLQYMGEFCTRLRQNHRPSLPAAR